MEVQGKIKAISKTEEVGKNKFRKRSVVIVTDEQYPQFLSLEFVQDKTELLDKFKKGQNVKIHINLRGREWIDGDGKAKYFNTIQGWRIEEAEATTKVAESTSEEPDDLPF